METYPIRATRARTTADPVECRSDAEYADRPLAFMWLGQRLVVTDILGRWRGPNEKGFRVITTSGQPFDLVYRESPDDWLIRPL